MKSNTMKKTRWCIVFANVFVGFLLWLTFPAIVPIHFNWLFQPDSWALKPIGLVIVLFPLYSCIPWEKLNPPEIHVDSEESRQILEKQIRKNESVKLIQACVLSAVMWGCLISTVLYEML